MAVLCARRARIALLLLALPALCAAQAAEPLGLREYLSLVERNNPELAAAREQRALAEGAARAARAHPNPEVDFSTGPWRSRVGGRNGSAQAFALTQPLDLPSVRTPRIAAAAAGIDAAEAQLRAARLAIGSQARLAFSELQRRLSEERLAQENAALLAQIQDRVRRRVEVGEAPRFELVRAEAEALTAQNARAASRLRVEEAVAAMRRLTANVLPPQFELRGAEPVPVRAPALPALQPDMLAAHPSLQVLAAERQRAQRRLEFERALRGPQPAVRVGESRDPEVSATSIGVTLAIPLWDRREGQIAQAQAGLDLVAAQQEQQRVQLLRELDSAHARFSITQRQIETFEAGLLRSAEAALQAAESAYRFGERSFLEVLDAQRTLRALRSDHIQAQFDRVAAWLDIERLLGRDPFEPEKP